MELSAASLNSGSLNSVTFTDHFNQGLEYHSLLDNYPSSYQQTTTTGTNRKRRSATNNEEDKDKDLNLPKCSLNQLLTHGQWKKNRYLSEMYTKELEKSGSLWRLDKGMPSLYYDNKYQTCGYNQKPVYGIKYKGNMWCDPHDPNRSCCSNNRCIPSKYCTDQTINDKLHFQAESDDSDDNNDYDYQNILTEDDLNTKIYEKQDIKNVNFFENKPIDFGDFVWPELSTFEIDEPNNCQPDLRTSQQACGVLQNNKAGIRNIYFVGDSLTLNYYIGFMAHVLNDYKYGPIEPSLRRYQSELSDNNKEQGTCNGYQEMLYRRTDCKALQSSKMLTNYNCADTSINFIDIRNKSDIWKVEDKISELRDINELESSIFVINAGTHEKFRFDMVIQSIMNRVLETNLPKKNLLWISQVRPSFNVPLKYNRKQNAWTRMKEFYKKMNKWTDKHNVNSLDLHPISANAFSPDGTHYSMGVQLMKTQLLLQYLEELEI